jgi:hypothetical protein
LNETAAIRINKLINNVHSDSPTTQSAQDLNETEVDLERFKQQLKQGDSFYIRSIRDAKSKEAKTSIVQILHEYLADLKEAPDDFQIEVAKALGEFLNTNTRILDGEQINTIGDYWDNLVKPNTAQGQLANIISRLSLGKELN